MCTNLVDGIRILRYIKDDGCGSPLHRSLCLPTQNKVIIRYIGGEKSRGMHNHTDKDTQLPKLDFTFYSRPLEGVLCPSVTFTHII